MLAVLAVLTLLSVSSVGSVDTVGNVGSVGTVGTFDSVGSDETVGSVGSVDSSNSNSNINLYSAPYTIQTLSSGAKQDVLKLKMRKHVNRQVSLSFQYSLKCCDIVSPSYIVWKLISDLSAGDGKSSSSKLGPHTETSKPANSCERSRSR